MISTTTFQAIADVDLDPIKVKLMHQASGEGWTLEKADAVEFEYRRFLYLMKMFPAEQTAPLFDVDTFWHYHILDTQKYAADCQQIFGYFLHHFPYLGLRGEDDEAAHRQVGERMRELYLQTFGEDDVQATSAYSGAPARIAYSGAPAGIAYSGAPARIAYSGAPSAKLAYSGAPAVAYSGAPTAAPGQGTGLYSQRPSLR
jgi:hypothetical protein